MPFWQCFRMGGDGYALLVRPSRIPLMNLRILFVLGSYESLERLKGKIGEATFFMVQSGKITVCMECMEIRSLFYKFLRPILYFYFQTGTPNPSVSLSVVNLKTFEQISVTPPKAISSQ